MYREAMRHGPSVTMTVQAGETRARALRPRTQTQYIVTGELNGNTAVAIVSKTAVILAHLPCGVLDIPNEDNSTEQNHMSNVYEKRRQIAQIREFMTEVQQLYIQLRNEFVGHEKLVVTAREDGPEVMRYVVPIIHEVLFNRLGLRYNTAIYDRDREDRARSSNDDSDYGSGSDGGDNIGLVIDAHRLGRLPRIWLLGTRVQAQVII